MKQSKQLFIFLLLAFLVTSAASLMADNSSDPLADAPDPDSYSFEFSGTDKAIDESKAVGVDGHHHPPGGNPCDLRPVMDKEKFRKCWLGADDDQMWYHKVRDLNCTYVSKAILAIWAYDVDSGDGEENKVYVDGHYVGMLKGRDERPSVTEFEIDPAWINDDGKIKVYLDVDATDDDWLVQLGWSVLAVELEWKPPVADFVAYPNEGVGPLKVRFKNMSHCAEHYYWDFGDGSYSYDENPCHTYDDVQKYYTVTLYARGCGGADEEVKTDYITVNKAVQANFEASMLAGGPGLQVMFTNNSGGNGNHYLWDYGDGNTEEFTSDVKNQYNPTHEYAEAGEYAVTLKVWGNGGMNMVSIPGLIYVDDEDDYLPLVIVEEGETYPGEGWENAIDNDIYGNGASVGAASDDAWATFMFADTAYHEVRKLRLLTNTVEEKTMTTNLARTFDVYAVLDEENFELVYSGETVGNDGEWETFVFDEPFTAKEIKVVLTSARGEHSKYREIAELQFFGSAEVSEGSMGKSLPGQVVSVLPTSYDLNQNYPNPFNPETTISYQVPEAARVTLSVYNVQGQLIQTLVNNQVAAGSHQIVWNGKDLNGVKVGSGLYIYKIQASNDNGEIFSFSRKMTLMK